MKAILAAALAFVGNGAHSDENTAPTDWVSQRWQALYEAGAYYRSLPADHPEKRCLQSQTCYTVADGKMARWMIDNYVGLCGLVNSMTLDTGQHGYKTKYAYQALILGYSGVLPTDSKAEVAAKTRVMAPAIMALDCSNPHFNQPGGNVLKWAIAKQFDNFVVDVAHTWQWGDELNKVDARDGRTALDYAYDEYAAELQRKSSIANKVKTYITIMERNGAKRAKDL